MILATSSAIEGEFERTLWSLSMPVRCDESGGCHRDTSHASHADPEIRWPTASVLHLTRPTSGSSDPSPRG